MLGFCFEIEIQFEFDLYHYQLFTWGWNQRGTLGHQPSTKTENIPSQVKALDNVKIIQVKPQFTSRTKN